MATAILRRAAVLLPLLLVAAGGRAATPPGAEAARRILVLLSATGEEYREGLDESGRVVRPLEVEEACLLLAEAQARAGELLSPLGEQVTGRLGEIERAVRAHAAEGRVLGEIKALRNFVVEATGVREDLAPPSAPSPDRGRAIFATHCSSCHGPGGAGDGAQAAELTSEPADLTDAVFMRGETPIDFFHVISLGRRLGAMPAWEEVLSVQERWDVVSYIWTLATAPQQLAEGQGTFLAQCAGCHGATGRGEGPYASLLPKPVGDLTAMDQLAGRNDAELFHLVSDGIDGTAMPGFGRTLDEQDRWAVVAFVRGLSLGGVGRPSGGGGRPANGEGGIEPRLAETKRLVDEAVAAYRRGDAAAGGLATDAYMHFEPLETQIGATDPAAVRRVEERFLGLRTALQQPGHEVEVNDRAAALHGEIDAITTSTGEAGAWARLVQSATIILREGFEAVLIIGALLAWVMRLGQAHMRRPVYVGSVLGLAASVATAIVLTTVPGLGPGTSEVVEGLAMLVAAGVLFWVSYWIVSKAEAERWQRYIRSKVQAAVASGSGSALALTAFVAIYREGFETVLFYRALLASAPPGDAMVGTGFVVGTMLLGFVYLLVKGVGLRLPTTQLFLVTGGLLYLMAFIFAGTGVHALQAAGVVALTVVPWAPHVGFLGIFPTVESLLVQGVLVGLLLYALLVTLRRPAREAAELESVRDELRRLRELAEAMRAELVALRVVDEAVFPPGLDARLDGLIARVRDIEARVPTGNGQG